MKISSVILCENVLSDLDGRTALFNVFPVFRAGVFPATAAFMVVTFVLGEAGDRPGTLRIAVVDSDGNLIGESRAPVPAQGPGGQFLQISRFAGVVFPRPGLYRVEGHLEGSGELAAVSFVVSEG